MASRRKRRDGFPETLMDEIRWTFWGEPYPNQAAFEDAVAEEMGPDWDADQWLRSIVLHVPRVRIATEYWDWDEDEPVLDLTPDNGVGFTAGELLFKIHNAWVTVLRELDHKFFEGMTLAEQPEAGMPPVYELDLGS